MNKTLKEIKEILDKHRDELRDKIAHFYPVLADFLGYDLQSDINPEDRIGKGFIDEPLAKVCKQHHLSFRQNGEIF